MRNIFEHKRLLEVTPYRLNWIEDVKLGDGLAGLLLTHF